MEKSDEWKVIRVVRIVWWTLGVLVGGIFIYAGASKALNPVRFATDVDNYKLVPWSFAVGIAFYLPWLEIFSGLAVVLRKFYRGGLLILTLLILVFLVVTIAAKVRGLDITCGCFGRASEHWSFPQHLAVDLAILIGLVALFGQELVRKEYQPGNEGR